MRRGCRWCASRWPQRRWGATGRCPRSIRRSLQTIRGMVEGLAARLKDQPHDLGGQLRLMRAWAMLGDAAKAKAAAAAATGAFAGDDAALRRIDDLLLGLGLSG